jgi:hypothetical protein
MKLRQTADCYLFKAASRVYERNPLQPDRGRLKIIPALKLETIHLTYF